MTPWAVVLQAPLSLGFFQARILQQVAISSPKLINRLYFKTSYQYQNILFHFLEHIIELLTCLSKTISVQMCNFYPTIKNQKIPFPFSLNNTTSNIYHPPSLLLLLLVLSGFLNSGPLFWAISLILMYTLSPLFLSLVAGRLKEPKKSIKRKRGERYWPLTLGFTFSYTVGIEIALPLNEEIQRSTTVINFLRFPNITDFMLFNFSSTLCQI